MDYIQEKNELWKQILEKRTRELAIEIPNELLSYLSSWKFTDFHYDDVFEDDLSGEYEEGIHSGIRFWDVEIDGQLIEFAKKENYIFSDVQDEWTIQPNQDFEEYLNLRFHLTIDQLMWTLETIDELIFTI